MSEYVATIRWHRAEQDFLDDQYSRAHQWEFAGGLQVPASASPHIVALPMAVAENIDPEEAFVASLASCHMLFFLSLAAMRGFVVDDYKDAAIGVLAKSANGIMAMTKITLRPAARYSGEKIPAAREVEELHKRAHSLCFIANSVKSEVLLEIIS